MALSFGKKGDQKEKGTPKATGRVAPSKKQKQPKEPKQPKQSKPVVPPDIYTLLLGLAALFFIVTTIVLGLNYYWYQSVEPAVLPLSWAK